MRLFLKHSECSNRKGRSGTKTILCFFFIVGALLSSCQSDDVGSSDSVQVSTADSLKAYPGKNRIALKWIVNDDNIQKAVAFNDTGDSIEVSSSGQSEMKAVFDDLEEGNHSLGVVLYDKNENVSKRKKIVSQAYGDEYIESLSPRGVADAIFDEGKVSIHWDAPEEDGLGTDVRYIDEKGDTIKIPVKTDIDSTVLTTYKPGTYFDIRSQYKPVPEAIDTFYSKYTSAKEFSTFTNPLFADKGADPWVVYKNGWYYFTYTQGGGITLYATKKMSQLGAAEPIEVWRPPSGSGYSKNLWAPELHFINDKWYVYFAADNGKDINHRMYAIENDSPDPLKGDWEFKGEIEESSDNWAIDGTILKYEDELYFIWAGKTGGTFPENLYIAKMSDPYTLEGERIEISTPEYDWEKQKAAINEAPEILKNKEDDVFLVYSASMFNSDDYSLGMLCLKKDSDPLNPDNWEKDPEPVFKRKDEAGAFAPGHNGFFKSRDGTENWIIYHARSFPNQGSTNYRNPRIQKFSWNEDGTPNFGEPVNINEPLTTPSGEF